MKNALISAGVVSLALVALLVLFPPRGSQALASQQVPAPPYVLGELLVKFEGTASEYDRAQALDELDAQVQRTYRSGAEHWKFDPAESVEEAVAWLSANPAVEFAHPNYRIVSAFDPNDVRYPQQWHLNNTGQNLKDPNDPSDPNIFGTSGTDMDVNLAWDLFSSPNLAGSTNVIIAVLDYGVMPTHVDLADSMWVNTAEDVDGVDDDLNGCIDDINGCNFVDPNGPNGNITEDILQNHANAVMGVIGARGNNIGVSGVMRRVSLMSLKMQPTDALDPNVGLAAAIDAIEYGIAMGADIMNASWHLQADPNCATPCAPALRSAIEEAGEHEILFVTAAGNSAVSVDSGGGGDRRFPCMYDLPNLICVANTDQDDTKAADSNWGAVSVDIAGTGNNIWTLKSYDPNFAESLSKPRYKRVTGGGTSLASPSVAGVAGLMRAKSPDIPFLLMRNQLLDPNSIDYLAALDPNTGTYPIVTGGRANAYKALADYDPNAPTAISSLAGTASGTGTFSIGWTSTGDDGSSGVATLYQVRTSTSTITSGNWLSAARSGSEPAPDPNGAGVSQSMTVSGLSAGTAYSVALRAFDEWGNGPLSNVITCRTRGGCTTSFCKPSGEVFKRCTFNNTYGSGCDGCCQYTCVVDETCEEADPCPPNACSPACS